MNVTLVRTCVLAALVAAAPLAHAQSPASPEPSASLDPAAAPFDLTVAPTATLAVAPAPSLALVQPDVPGEELLGVHYRPARSGWGRRVDANTVTQIHVGFFDPSGAAGGEFLLGARGGPMLDPHVQIGLGLDWSHLANNASSATRSVTGPGGTTITTTPTDLSSSSIDIFPIMAFAQYSGDDGMSVVPFAGVGGGYEVVNLTADNYAPHQNFDATYGGWGWQAWVGAAVPLSGQVRLSGEVFVNTAEPGRDVSLADGTPARETVKIDGAGMRFGLAWGF